MTDPETDTYLSMTDREAAAALATILGTIMMMSDEAQAKGGATCIAGVAALHRLQTSLQKSGPRLAKIAAAVLSREATR